MHEQRQLAFRFMDDHETIEALGNGPLFLFSEWPTGNVPRTGSLVYTV